MTDVSETSPFCTVTLIFIVIKLEKMKNIMKKRFNYQY